MARREQRIRLYTKLGVAASAISVAGAIVTASLMLQQWNFQENVILMGPVRTVVIMLGLLSTVTLGFVGLTVSLYGPAHQPDTLKSLGWSGFLGGMVGGMLGLVLAVCFVCFRVSV